MFEQIRTRYKAYLIGDGRTIAGAEEEGWVRSLETAVESHLSMLVRAPEPLSRTRLFEDLHVQRTNQGSRRMTDCFYRLRDMAMAYQAAGSRFYCDRALLQDIREGLEWLHLATDADDPQGFGGIGWYHPAAYPHYYDRGALAPPNQGLTNWWNLEFGNPMAILDLYTLLYEELNADLQQRQLFHRYLDTIDRYANSPAWASGGIEGANGVWICWMVALRAILAGNPQPTDEQKCDPRYARFRDVDKLTAASIRLGELIDYARGRNGFFPDGSYVDHNYYPYTGGYGLSMLNDMAKSVFLLSRSPFALSSMKVETLCRFVFDSFEPFLFRTNFMDMVRGREIGRARSQTVAVGKDLIAPLVLLSEFTVGSRQEEIKRLLKYYIQQFISLQGKTWLYNRLPIYIVQRLERLLDDESVLPRDELVLHKQFPQMNKAVHYRPHFAVGISMFSQRIYSHEDGGEFKSGWHVSDGMTYLYNADQLQFDDGFWPTVDPYRLPGTTVNCQTGVWGIGGRSNRSNWAGGTVLEGLYGTVGMELVPDTPLQAAVKQADGSMIPEIKQTLHAYKSWFLFDEEVVALGSGISARDGKFVETIVENRKLKADASNALTVNSACRGVGWSEKLNGVRWVHLEGNVPGAEIGYYFYSETELNMQRVSRSGHWNEMNDIYRYDDEPMTRHYLTMYLDHGLDPVNAHYAYVLLPGKSVRETTDYTSNPGVLVVENSEFAHCVRKPSLGLMCINFWTDRVTTVDDFITSDNKASVMLKETPDTLLIGISDPTMANKGSVRITIHLPVDGLIVGNERIQVSETGKGFSFTFQPDGSNGQTQYFSVRKM